MRKVTRFRLIRWAARAAGAAAGVKAAGLLAELVRRLLFP